MERTTAGHGLDPSLGFDALSDLIAGGMPYAEAIGDFAAPESEDLECLETEKSQFFQTTYYHSHDCIIRRLVADDFTNRYTYGSLNDGPNNRMEQRTCIWPGGSSSWEDQSSGIMWVGVHGMDSICVVTRSDYLDPTRLRGSLKLCTVDDILFRFRQSVIVDIEDLADQSSKACQKRIKKPFGVVSAIPDYYKSRKGSVEYGVTKAAEFLLEKARSDTVFTVTETIQTAIAAFGHLFQKKFKADEIQVSVMDPSHAFDDFKGTDPAVEDLKIHQINEHLALINKPNPSA